MIKKNILDKGFVIKRKYVQINGRFTRGEVIRIVRKHGCTVLKDGRIMSNKGENILCTTEGQMLQLNWLKSRGFSFVTR